MIKSCNFPDKNELENEDPLKQTPFQARKLQLIITQTINFQRHPRCQRFLELKPRCLKVKISKRNVAFTIMRAFAKSGDITEGNLASITAVPKNKFQPYYQILTYAPQFHAFEYGYECYLNSKCICAVIYLYLYLQIM